MNYLILLYLLTASLLNAHQTLKPYVYIGGDVPKPGDVMVSGESITLREILKASGLNLTKYNSKDLQGNQSIGIIIYASEWRVLNPEFDALSFDSIKLVPFKSYVRVKDFSDFANTLKMHRKKLVKLLEDKSLGIVNHINLVAVANHEYSQWKARETNGKIETIDSFVRQEIERLLKPNNKRQFIELLETYIMTERDKGLGATHSRLIKATRIIDFAERIPKSNK